MINNRFRTGNQFRRYEARRPVDGKRRQMPDMGRQKYFRFDLEDMLSAFNLGDNKTTTAATILNKMSSHSLDDAIDYVSRLEAAEKLSGEQAQKLRFLLQRYSKWR